MPFVNIKITDTAVSKEQKQMLIAGTTRLLVEILNKKPETTHVVIEEINLDNWGVGGKQLSHKVLNTQK